MSLPVYAMPTPLVCPDECVTVTHNERSVSSVNSIQTISCMLTTYSSCSLAFTCASLCFRAMDGWLYTVVAASLFVVIVDGMPQQDGQTAPKIKIQVS